MKMTLEMTNEIATIDGVPCRIWIGESDNGVPVRVYIHRVAVPLGQIQTPFQIELLEKMAPHREERRYD